MAKKDKKNSKKSQIIIAFFVIIFIIVSYTLDKNGIWDSLNSATSPGTATINSNPDDSVLLTAYFIDVGQGDCSLFISNEAAMLIDSGEQEYADTVIKVLKEYGIKELDYAVATHAHSDHIGGLADILTTVPTKNIILSEPSDNSSQTATYEKFLDAIDECNANVILAEPEYIFTLGDARCEIIAPYEVSQTEENNNSIVMSVTTGETTFLLTGDAEKSVEREIIKKRPELHADIIKIGHHGSKTSSAEEFLSMLNPETAVISVGEGNKYKHPSDATLETLNKLTIPYYRTDICGTITVTCTDSDYSISTEI